MMRGPTKMLMVRNRSDDMPDERNRPRNEYNRPYNDSKGTLTWDNTHGAESAYRGGYGGRIYPRYDGYTRSEMDEPEARRRRDSRGRFRSEMDDPDVHYPMYPPPVYDNYGEMNQIGFAAHDGSERNNLHMIRGGAGHSEHLDKQTAEKWMESLHNEDGTKGPHWTMEQTNQVLNKKGFALDPVEFWAVMNAVYSDYAAVAKKYNVNNVDYYADLAKAWLTDADAVPNKPWVYCHYIAK